jgi:CDP-diacylglycerol--glycerol-3-phosphate 3-phosphatidyltransferase
MKGLANICSLLRIVCIPGCVYLLVYTPTLGWWLFVLLSLTDGVDGWLARRCDDVTALGALLDPVADKLLSHSALWVYMCRRTTLCTMLCLMILTIRDVAITFHRLKLASHVDKEYAVNEAPVTWLSKSKSLLLFFALAIGLCALTWSSSVYLLIFADICIAIATFAAVYSFLRSFVQAKRMIAIR